MLHLLVEHIQPDVRAHDVLQLEWVLLIIRQRGVQEELEGVVGRTNLSIPSHQ